MSSGPALEFRGTIRAINRRMLVIGRSDSATTPDLDLADWDSERTVSRQHARLRWQQGSVTIEDLGSLNGTFVEGRRLREGESAQLSHGCAVRFGTLSVHYSARTEWPDGVVAEWDERTVEQDNNVGANETVILDRHPVETQEPTPVARRRWWSPASWFGHR